MEETVKNTVEDVCALCKNCRKMSITDSETDSGNNSYDKCSKWLRTTSYSDGESVCSSEISERSDATKSSEESEGYGDDYTSGNREIVLCNDLEQHEQSELILQNSVNSYRNVTITKSKNVHLGNITYINGPVYVNQTANIVNSQTVVNQYINNNNELDIKPPRIVDRRGWVAQPPLSEPEERKGPAKFVIITHTATEEASTQPDNVLIVRLIQQFHIESRKWDDIGYNFLVGGDSNVYEGRGWKSVGAHTYCYNKHSIGIAFVGCYMNRIPPRVSMDAAKRLIEYGVKIGAIDVNYRLLGHCQCTPTESPGRMLFAEVKTWKNWCGDIDLENPAPEIREDL